MAVAWAHGPFMHCGTPGRKASTCRGISHRILCKQTVSRHGSRAEVAGTMALSLHRQASQRTSRMTTSTAAARLDEEAVSGNALPLSNSVVKVGMRKGEHTSMFGPRAPGSHPAAYNEDAAFAAFPHLNDPTTLAGMLRAAGIEAEYSSAASHGPLVQLPADTGVATPAGSSTQARAQAAPADGQADGQSASRSSTSQLGLLVGARHRVGSMPSEVWISSGKVERAVGRLQRAARAVASTGAVDAKEVFEAAEFVARVRRRVRRSCIVDVAAGHGLAGLMLAAVDQEVVQHVVLVDVRRPVSHDLAAAALRAAGLLQDRLRVTYLQDSLPALSTELSEALSRAGEQAAAAASSLTAQQVRPGKQADQVSGASSAPPDREAITAVCTELVAAAAVQRVGVVAVHACGSLTDGALALAMALRAPVAAMPCCYSGTSRSAPLAARRALGVSLAADLHRCYTLQAAGVYAAVDFASIPRAVTPMNRIIVAESARKM